MQANVKSRQIFSRIALFLVGLFIVLVGLIFAIPQSPHEIVAHATLYFDLEGEGTVQSPYLISSPSDLLELSNKVNNEGVPTVEKVFALTANIDMSTLPEGTAFQSIGKDKSHTFDGHFKGKKDAVTYVISNLVTDGNGLFGYISSTAVIEGVGLSNSVIGNSALTRVGGIVGVNLGKVSYCFFNGTVKGLNSVGGIVGENGETDGLTGEVEFCYSSGKIVAGGSFLGGVVGKNYRRINCVYSLSEIESGFWETGNDNGNIGGVLGGRMPGKEGYNTTPTYAYFDKSINYTGLNAIGYGTASGEGASIDTSPVSDAPDSPSHRFAGIESQEFETKTLNDLFGVSYESHWQKNKYKANDFSAWYAPVLKAYVPTGSEFLENLHFRNSVAIRRYGYAFSEYEWGTENNPYLIENTSQFNSLANATQNINNPQSYNGKFFLQTKDLDFSGVELKTVGKRHEVQFPFSGSYNGDGYGIYNFNTVETILANETYVGIFGYLSATSTVKNIFIDDTCNFVGRSFVGSLVGFSQRASVSNVHSRANVNATIDFGGGIIGYATGGQYKNILSEASFLGDNIPIDKHKGVFGNSESPYLSNVWYVDNSIRSNGVTGTKQQGNVLHFNASYGALNSSLDHDTSQISFIGIPNAGWEPSFRNIYEESLSPTNTYNPVKTEERRNLEHYLRFVREIDVNLVDLVGDAVNIDITAIPQLDAKFWAGQNFSIIVDISDLTNGYYLHDLEFYNEGQEIIDNPNYLVFEYEMTSKKIKFMTEMLEDAYELSIVIGNIKLNTYAFESPQTYSGGPVYEDIDPENDILGGVPNGFIATVDYYGINPINVTNNGRLAVVFVKDGVIRGRIDKSYVIEKKELSLEFSVNDHSVVETVKEFDGIGGLNENGDPIFQSTYVNQEKIIGVVDADKNNLSRLEITALISYASPDVSPSNNIQVLVKFSVKGSAKDNYIIPGDVDGFFGGITKRKIKVVVESPLKKEFDGNNPDIPTVYTVDYRSPTFPEDAKLKNKLKFSYSQGGGNPSYNVGEYTLKVDFEGSEGAIFILYFADPSGGEGFLEELVYEIVPKKCFVTYSGFLESSYDPTATGFLKYNPSRTMSYIANFEDIAKNSHSLLNPDSYRFYENGEIFEGHPNQAGQYRIVIFEQNLFGLDETTTKNYYLENPELEFEILKISQKQLDITSSTEASFGENYTLICQGGDGTGEVTWEIVEEPFPPISEDIGEGEINGDEILFIKAGVIVIKATKAGDRNYLEEVSQEFSLTISKIEMSIALESGETEYLCEYNLSFLFNGGSNLPAGFSPPMVYIYREGDISNKEIYQKEKAYDVGEYLLEIAGEGSSYGYNFTYIDGEIATLTVNKKPITIIAENNTIIYGEDDPSFAFEVVEDIREVQIVGSLSREEGRNVGEYTIGIGDLEEENPNFSINYEPGKLTIEKTAITIEIDGKEKLYGEVDPDISFKVKGLVYEDTIESISLAGKIFRIPGEDAYKSGNPSAYADYAYYVPTGSEAAFRHESGNYSEEITIVRANLRIRPASPTIGNKVQVKVEYGKTLENALYGQDESAIMPKLATATGLHFDSVNGWVEKTLEGTYSWIDARTKPTFKNEATFIAKALFNPQDRNYSALSFDLEIQPIRLPLTLSFSGETTFTYDGSAHKNISFSFLGKLGSDDLLSNISYNGDVINAGSYKAILNISNGNYYISNSNFVTIIVEKAPLTISHKNLTTPLNTQPAYNFIYEGFVEGEGSSSLKSLPRVAYQDKVGVIKNVEISGASADNYEISYLPFDITVLATEIRPENKAESLLFTGVFEEGIVCESDLLLSGLEYIKYAGKFEAAKAKDIGVEGTKISFMYSVKFIDKEGNQTTNSGVEKMTVTLTPEQIENFDSFEFFAVTNSGEVLLLEKPKLSGDKITFEVKEIASIMFLEPSVSTFNMLYLYVGLGAAAGMILIFAVAFYFIKSKRRQRVVSFKQDL